MNEGVSRLLSTDLVRARGTFGETHSPDPLP
jgi:hypothetical protein